MPPLAECLYLSLSLLEKKTCWQICFLCCLPLTPCLSCELQLCLQPEWVISLHSCSHKSSNTVGGRGLPLPSKCWLLWLFLRKGHTNQWHLWLFGVLQAEQPSVAVFAEFSCRLTLPQRAIPLHPAGLVEPVLTIRILSVDEGSRLKGQRIPRCHDVICSYLSPLSFWDMSPVPWRGLDFQTTYFVQVSLPAIADGFNWLRNFCLRAWMLPSEGAVNRMLEMGCVTLSDLSVCSDRGCAGWGQWRRRSSLLIHTKEWTVTWVTRRGADP